MSLAAIRRIKFTDLMEGRQPPSDRPWVYDCRTFDIPNTIVAAIHAAAKRGAVAITLSPRGGSAMVKAAEHAARKTGMRILWWTY